MAHWKSVVGAVRIRGFLALLAVALLAACATPATYQGMTVAAAGTAAANPNLKSAIEVAEVNGGMETDSMSQSEVDNAALRKALVASLQNAGYLAPQGAPATYQLNATLQNLNQPMAGFTMDVRSTILYTLRGAGVEKSYPITAVGSASPSDALVGVDRLRIANERSVQENIKAFLAALRSF